MVRFAKARRNPGIGFLISLLLCCLCVPATARQAEQAPPSTERSGFGQFFPVEQPIDSERAAALTVAFDAYLRDASARGRRPVILLELRPGASDFGPCLQLADHVARKLGAARKTVAFVPESLSGPAVLLALACDEIVMAPDATLGPIVAEGDDSIPGSEAAVAELARRNGRSPDLAVGMLQPRAELYRVETPEGADYVLGENLDEYRERRRVIERRDAWDAGAPGVLDAERARGEGIVQGLAADRSEAARLYDLGPEAETPAVVADQLRPVWIEVSGAIDSTQRSYLRRQIARAEKRAANLIVFQFDSPGGRVRASDDVASVIAELDGIKTVAYIRDGALGLATLPALACDAIVFHREGRMGHVVGELDGRGNDREIDEGLRTVLIGRAADLAEANGHPVAAAEAMVDPSAEIVEALDRQTGAVVLATRDDLGAEPDRFEERGTVTEGPGPLTADASWALRHGLAGRVVDDDGQLEESLGITDRLIRIGGPSWVDGLVDLLNRPVVSGLLLFVGFFMLVLEMKLPGIGLPAILATLSFLLFFWSHYLGGTADGLEIILFAVGLICLALEVFVFPGFGVFGMSGVLLILVSIVMASHTFVWPSEESQYRQMSRTLLQLVLSIVGVIAAIAVLSRYLPSMPLFNKLILRPGAEVDAPAATPAEDELPPKLDPDEAAPMTFLLGEVGQTTTVLRPSGHARFGELLVDVTADGFFIERGSRVQVVDVRGSRVIVKKI